MIGPDAANGRRLHSINASPGPDMRFIIQVVFSIALFVSILWLIYLPAFDSVLAAITSFAALLMSLLKKLPIDVRADQSQQVSSDSVAIQAGGDVRINKIEK